MAGPNYVLDKGFLAQAAIGSATDGADLATSYDYFIAVKAGTVADSVTPVTATTDTVLGVAQARVRTADINKEYVDVRMLGITKMVASAAITFGAKVNANASGQAAAVGAAGTNGIGIALSASGAAGDVIDVFLTPGVTV